VLGVAFDGTVQAFPGELRMVLAYVAVIKAVKTRHRKTIAVFAA